MTSFYVAVNNLKAVARTFHKFLDRLMLLTDDEIDALCLAKYSKSPLDSAFASSPVDTPLDI